MAWVNYRDMSWTRKQPLKYRSGDEKADSVVVYSSVVTLDDDARRLVPSGTVLCKITSGVGDGKYGPYSKTASDGRESLAADYVVVAVEGSDVTLGDKAVGGWFQDCVFDLSELTTNGVSKHGASLTSLKAALPQCSFRD